MWAIIGGSGFEKFESFKVLERLDTNTPFGNCSSGLSLIEVFGEKALFLSRHGMRHELLPSELNYKANIFALKKYGAKKILSISAVGSLQEELAPGDLVVPSQYINRTNRPFASTTFLGQGLVGHLSLAEPIEPELFKILPQLLQEASFKTHFKKTYICMEGPNFSTKAESHMYRQWGADIIGMTNFPEYNLAKEANLLYIPLSFVTDYDCWREEKKPVTLEEVIAIMKSNNQKAFSIIEKLIKAPQLNQLAQNYQPGLPNGLMGDVKSLDAKNQDVLKVLAGVSHSRS